MAVRGGTARARTGHELAARRTPRTALVAGAEPQLAAVAQQSVAAAFDN
ncbi:hypothetical protein [Kribbella qitaiheensis]|nr:hypothetical protein [Kribbella qitaiheensis]